MSSKSKYGGSGTVATVAAIALFCGACGPGAGDEGSGEAASLRVAESGSAAADPATVQRATAMLEEELARVESRLDSLPGLILSVRRTLRRHLNEDHVARARALGIPAAADTAAIERLAAADELVRLEDSTRHWVVRDLDQSLPYVTPAKKRVLEQLGDRFHARLREAGLPPFRFEISSALRTDELQQVLRARNANASETRSSHEFGTTVDIAYNEFSPPSTDEWAPWRDAVPGSDEGSERLRRRLDGVAQTRLDSLGNAYSDHLKGELGAVLEKMQAEGVLWPLYERSQPVFHTTLASPPGPGGH